MKRIFRLIVKFPKSVLAIFSALALFFGYFCTHLEIDASSQTLLLENDKDLEIWREVSARYATPNFFVVAYTPSQDLLSKQTLSNIAELNAKFSALDFVDSVVDLGNVPLLLNKKGDLSELLKHIPTLKDADIDLAAAKRELLTSPFYASNLVSADFGTTGILINLKPEKKYEELLRARDSAKNALNLAKKSNLANSEISNLKQNLKLAEQNFKAYRDELRIKDHENLQNLRAIIAEFSSAHPSERLFLGGINMIADDMISYVRGDLSTYGVGALVLLLACFWLFFRQAKFIVLPLIICAYSVMISSGLFGLLGFEITVISSNFIALVLIITVSVCIHLIVAYREYSARFPSFSQRQLVYAVLRERAKPCFFAIFTTIVGFMSLIFCDIKPVISLGIMMSVGIACSLVVVFCLFGAVMSISRRTHNNRSFEKQFRFTHFCANLALNHRGKIYAVCALAVLAGIFGISKLRVENSFIGYFKENTPIYAGMEVIDTKLGGTIPLDIVIKFPKSQSAPSEEMDEFEAEYAANENDPKYWFSSQKMRIINKTHAFLKDQNISDHKFIGQVSSLSSLLQVGREINSGEELDDLMLALIYSELPENYREMVLSPYVSIEENEAHFSVRTIDSDPNLRRNEFLQNLQNDLDKLLANDGVSAQVSGIMVLYNNMLQTLMSSQIGTLGITVGVLFVLFVFIFRSFSHAFIAILVNLIPLCVCFGIMGILGIPLDIMSITIAAISIGIGVDDVIHYLFRFRREFARTQDSAEAIRASHASIGYAMYYTSFAIILGFSVMMISNFWPTIYFGLLICLVMALLLLGALIILPSLLMSKSRLKI